MHGERDVVSDRTVGSDPVVVSTPILRFFPGVRKAPEPVCIEAFRPEIAVEHPDEPDVGGLARP